jgi:hypothetical protein
VPCKAVASGLEGPFVPDEGSSGMMICGLEGSDMVTRAQLSLSCAISSIDAGTLSRALYAVIQRLTIQSNQIGQGTQTGIRVIVGIVKFKLSLRKKRMSGSPSFTLALVANNDAAVEPRRTKFNGATGYSKTTRFNRVLQ